MLRKRSMGFLAMAALTLGILLQIPTPAAACNSACSLPTGAHEFQCDLTLFESFCWVDPDDHTTCTTSSCPADCADHIVCLPDFRVDLDGPWDASREVLAEGSCTAPTSPVPAHPGELKVVRVERLAPRA